MKNIEINVLVDGNVYNMKGSALNGKIRCEISGKDSKNKEMEMTGTSDIPTLFELILDSLFISKGKNVKIL